MHMLKTLFLDSIRGYMASTATDLKADLGQATANTKRRIARAKLHWEEELGWDDQAEDTRDALISDDFDDQYNQMMRTVQMIGGAVIGIAVVVIVVNSVLTTDVVANTSGPFDGVIGSLETTGVAAMSLLVVGLLVAAASKLMSFFGGGF